MCAHVGITGEGGPRVEAKGEGRGRSGRGVETATDTTVGVCPPAQATMKVFAGAS